MMSGNTSTAKRVNRTLQRASPVKEQRVPIPREDIENLSAVTLAALGMAPAPSSVSSSSATSTTTSTKTRTPDSSMAPTAVTPQASDRLLERMSKTSSEMYATPPSTVMPAGHKSRTISSGSTSHVYHTSSTRTRDRTATSSSSVASSSDVSSPHVPHSSTSAPLTAIRRPAPQIHQTTTTTTPGHRSASLSGKTGMKASPSSLKLSTNGTAITTPAVRSRKSSNTNSSMSAGTPASSVRSRAPSSDVSRLSSTHKARAQEEQQEEEKTDARTPKGVFVTQEEYSSLVALLSAKDEQISSLQTQVEEGKKELSGMKERNNKLQKERDALISETKELLKAAVPSSAPSSATKEGSGSPSESHHQQGGEATISSREYETFKKQYEMQENLLEGFQRENEKATIELEALKKREKHLTEQLKKIYGPTFSIDDDLNPLTPDQNGVLKRYPGSLINNGYGPGSPVAGNNSGVRMLNGEQHRRKSGFGLVADRSVLASSLKTAVTNPSTQGDGGIDGNEASDMKRMEVDPAVLMEQLIGVQALLERFEKRLLVRESELIKKEREALEQMEKLQTVVVA